MKFSNIFSLFALTATLLPALVAAGGEDNDSCSSPSRQPSYGYDKGPDHDKQLEQDHDGPDHGGPDHGEEASSSSDRQRWSQCGGYYYKGTKECPEGAYCRWFSDWYSQCNLNDN